MQASEASGVCQKEARHPATETGKEVPHYLGSLRARVIRGSSWTLAGYGVSQLIRLGTNVVVARLLFPEAYGLMALVGMLLYGLGMFSDVGVGPAIVRDERGDDPSFLNTAWTAQIMRGFLLWCAAGLLAVPMARFYGEPELAQLIPVAAITAIIEGFNSTALFSLQRRMQFGYLTGLEVVTRLVSSVTIILWCLIHPTVWALVGGSLTAQAFRMALSHRLLAGSPNRLHWERAAARAMFHFGKWIFLSSAFYFLATQSDRLLLGRYLDLSLLGVYSIALLLSDAIRTLATRILHTVVFPAYSRIFREDRDRLRVISYQARLAVDVLFLVPTAVLLILGGAVVELLFDERYVQAGWMFQILCIRVLMSCTLLNGEACLVALGRPQYAFLQNLGRTAWILLGIPIGWSINGIAGTVWVIALSEIPVLFVIWGGLWRHAMLDLGKELRSLAFVAIGLVVGFGLLELLE